MILQIVGIVLQIAEMIFSIGGIILQIAEIISTIFCLPSKKIAPSAQWAETGDESAFHYIIITCFRRFGVPKKCENKIWIADFIGILVYISMFA
jgi:hypothetical protein